MNYRSRDFDSTMLLGLVLKKAFKPNEVRPLLSKFGRVRGDEARKKWADLLVEFKGDVVEAEQAMQWELAVPPSWKREVFCQHCGPVLLRGERDKNFDYERVPYVLVCDWCGFLPEYKRN